MSTLRLPDVDRLLTLLAVVLVVSGLLRMLWPVATPLVEPLPLPELNRDEARGNIAGQQATAFGNYRVIVDQSVFSPLRRAVPEEPPVATNLPDREASTAPHDDVEPPAMAASPPAAVFVLLGVARTAEQSLALVRNENTGEYRVLGVNDETDGWRVHAITGTTLVLHNGEQESTLVMPAVTSGQAQ